MLIPIWMKVYVAIFIVLVISNTIFHFKYKIKKIFFIYELLSAVYMLFLIYAYWTPSVLNTFTIINILPLILIIGVDFYFTIWGNSSQLGIKVPEVSRSEQETAKVVSIIFASPAYIVGLMLALTLITNNHIKF